MATSTDPTYLSCILNTGKLLIGEAFTQGKKVRPYAYAIGDTFNFTPSEDATNIVGNLVYTGGSALITGSILSQDTFKFNTIIPESAGDFIIGNMILYMQTDDGTVFPFIFVAMKIPYPKQKRLPNTVGNRFIFEFVEKIINANDVLQMTLTTSQYASLAGYVDEFSLPNPSQALFQQFYVQEPKFIDVPFIGARRSIDNSYWGMPLYSRLGDPFFGVLDGGRVGDQSNRNAAMFWGGDRNFADGAYRINYGGGSIQDDPAFSFGGGYIFD